MAEGARRPRPDLPPSAVAAALQRLCRPHCRLLPAAPSETCGSAAHTCSNTLPASAQRLPSVRNCCRLPACYTWNPSTHALPPLPSNTQSLPYQHSLLVHPFQLLFLPPSLPPLPVLASPTHRHAQARASHRPTQASCPQLGRCCVLSLAASCHTSSPTLAEGHHPLPPLGPALRSLAQSPASRPQPAGRAHPPV